MVGSKYNAFKKIYMRLSYEKNNYMYCNIVNGLLLLLYYFAIIIQGVRRFTIFLIVLLSFITAFINKYRTIFNYKVFYKNWSYHGAKN